MEIRSEADPSEYSRGEMAQSLTLVRCVSETCGSIGGDSNAGGVAAECL